MTHFCTFAFVLFITLFLVRNLQAVLVRTIPRRARPPCRWTIATRIVVGVVLAITGTFPRTVDAQPWRIETVSATPGSWTAIAVTPDGTPRIAYATTGGVKSDEYPWGNPSTVSSDNPDLISMDLATDGTPAYAWVNRNPAPIDDYIRVVSPYGGFPTVQCSSQPTLKIDGNDVEHLVFSYDEQCDNIASLHYRTRAPGEDWENHSTVVTTLVYDYPGRVMALDLGLGDDPGLAHFSGIPGFLKLRYKDNLTGGGSGPIVFDSDNDVEHIALAIDDGNDQPHIVFNDATAGEFRYATRTGGDWTTDIISRSDGDRWWYGSIVIDSDGTPHVAFFNQETGTVRFARPSGSFWVQQTLETVGTSGGYTSIAIDDYDGIHVSYYDATDTRIRYASSLDCNDNNLHDLDEIDAGLLEDCDNNGHPDECEIALGFAEDCDDNGVPDVCDPDCNGNGIPDACESFEDCNRNDIPDECDLASGTSLDCNGNGIPDECDITYGGLPDCDKNGVPDECDFASGNPVDCNGNLEIDLCELPDAWHVGGQEYGWFGEAVASGDFDADGFTDIAVGQPSWSGAKGRVHVYYGGDPMDTVADEVMSWNNSGDQYGKSVATGNLNGDAYDDLVIGIPGYLDYYGVVIAFVGTAGADLTYLDSWAGHQTFSNFGASVALADVTGDGLDDVIVGAPAQNTNQDPGHAYVYDATNLRGNPIEIWDGYANDDDFGSSVANAGDVDGNGRDDVIVGTGFFGTNSGLVGYARLFLSQTGGMVEGPALATGVAGDLYGYAVNTAGDLNDDGYDDFVVTAPYSGVLGDRPGRAFLYFGSDNPDATADLVFEGAEHLADLGSAVAPAGDVNADGFPDLIISSDHLHNGTEYAWVDVFFGGPHLDVDPDQRIFSDRRGYGMGWAVASGGDTDGDGILEVLIGHPQYSSSEFFEGRVSLLQLSLPDFGDCNLNGVVDMCDISSGNSADEDGNGIPDECGDVAAVDDPAPRLRTRLLGAYPTPFNPRTELRFELAASSLVDLRVFDLSGRLIKTLAQGESFGVGRHALPWQGRDNDGRQVASGVYFYRFEAGGYSDVGRMMLVK